MKREALQVGLPQGVTITRHHHQDAPALAQEVLDQDGAYALWSVLHASGEGEHHYVARDANGNIHGLLTGSEDVLNHFMHDLRTSQNAPAGVGAAMVQAAARDALAGKRTLRAMGVMDSARHWWEAMGLKMQEGDENGAFTPQTLNALLAGNTTELPNTKVYKNTPMGKYPVPVDPDVKPWLDPARRAPGSARALQVAASTIEAAQRLLAGTENDLQDVYHLQKDDLEQYFADQEPIKPTPPVHQPAKDILNEWLQQRGNRSRRDITVECPSCRGTGRHQLGVGECNNCDGKKVVTKPEVEQKMLPWAERLENALYDEFNEWWPTSKASRTRSPETVRTKWHDRPNQPLTHWLNIEDFLKERYPEAATGGTYGGEDAGRIINEHLKSDRPGNRLDPKWLEQNGYVGWGNPITQAMLTLHNRENGRYWRTKDDRRKYFELMLRHIGPKAPKPRKAASILDAVEAIRQAQQILAMPAVDAYDNNIPRKKRISDPYVPQGPWYHATNQELPDGTVLVPGGGPTNYGEFIYRRPQYKNRANWVWLAPSVDYAKRWGEHIYEVEPEVEGPWPWNGDGDMFTQFVAPRARIVRKLSPEEISEKTRWASHLQRAAATIKQAEQILAGWHTDPNFFGAVHEMAHVLDAVTGFKASATLHSVLVPLYMKETGTLLPPSYETGTPSWQKYNQWLKNNLPRRGWETRLDYITGNPSEFFYDKEAIASAFVEHELNPSASTPAMRALHQHLVDMSAKAGRPTNLTTFRLRAKPPKDIDPEDGTWPTGKLPRAFIDGIQHVFQKYPQSRIVDMVEPLEMSKGGHSPVTHTVLKTLDSKPRIEYDDRAALAPKLVDDMFHRQIENLDVSPWMWQDDTLSKAAAVLKFAEPLADAYDPRAEYRDDYIHPDRVTKLPTTRGKWYHISPHDLPVGTVLKPKGGHSPFFYDDDTPPEGRSRSSLPAKRKDWVWFERKPKMQQWLKIMQMAMPEVHLYEVKPEVEGPWPWNGTGEEGHVSPSATIVRKIPTKRNVWGDEVQILWDQAHGGDDDPLPKAAAAIRLAKAVLDDSIVTGLTNRLSNEYADWWKDVFDLNIAPKPRYDDWSSIEDFLKDKYPAAHRNLGMGLESASAVLDQKSHTWKGVQIHKPWGVRGEPYETGPEAVAKHGYDPAEVVAGMLYLHNDAHGYRHELKGLDAQRIMDIASARSKMQRKYEQSLKQKKKDPLVQAQDAIKAASQVLNDDYVPMQLHRGVGFQKGELPPEMEQRFEQAAAGQADPNFIKDLLLHLDRDGGGMGEFWAHGKDGPWLAQTYSARVWPDKWTNLPSHYRVLVDADWDGSESDVNYDTDPDYRKLLPGAKVRVRNIKIRTPDHDWFDLGGEPEGSVRYAAVFAPALTERLHKEFTDWYKTPEASDWFEHHLQTSGWPVEKLREIAQTGMDERGPIGYWPNIEGFLKAKYPAAHRNLGMGYEEARVLMDWDKTHPGQSTGNISPYETGPEAVAKYGYDPKEIAAAMLAMHNSSDPLRMNSDPEIGTMDIDRLNEIAQKRYQMQRKFEQRALADAKTALREAQQILAMPWRIEHPDYKPADVAKNYNPDIGGAQGGGDSRNFLVGPKNNVWWHGSASGDIGGGNASFGLHVGDYQTAADNLASRVGENPHHPEGRWTGTTSLAEAKPERFDENGNQKRDSSGYYSFTHSDGTPMHGSLRPNVFPVKIVGPMGNTTDTAASDGQAHALMRRQHTRPPKTPKGYYYINAAEGVGVSPETGIVSSVSAALPSINHVEKLDPAKYEHIAQEAHQNWRKNQNDPDRSSYDLNNIPPEDRYQETIRQRKEQERRVQEWRKRRRTP